MEKENWVLILSAIIIIIGGTFFWGFTVDDSFIGFRYADNIAKGHLFSWNYTDEQQFGLSNLLYTFLLVPAEYFGYSSLVLAKIIGILSAIGAMLFIKAIAKRFMPNGQLYLIAPLTFALMPITWIHSISGMETMFHTMLIAAATYFYIKYYDNITVKNAWIATLFITLVCFNRYDGLLFAVAVILHLVFIKQLKNKESIIFIVPIISFGILMLFNLYWYGQPMPNPFYNKSVISLGLILTSTIWIALFFGANFGLVSLGSRSKIKSIWKELSFPIIAVIIFLLPYFKMSQEMNFMFRFYYPIVPLLIVIFAYSIYLINHKHWKIIMAAIFILQPLILLPSAYGLYKDYGLNLIDSNVKIGKIFGNYPDFYKYHLTALDAGAIPYYSKWHAYDYYVIDSYYRDHGLEMDRFYSQDLEAMIITFVQPTNLSQRNIYSVNESYDQLMAGVKGVPSREQMISDPRFKDYSLVAYYTWNPVRPLFSNFEYVYYYVFIRNDKLEEFKDLIKELQDNANSNVV